ncbi:hypothetical protein [Streptomyces sp. NPDC087294]|uniref:hypothetical protein n=1 Tax=Streptomyces sp. NPDC087294 TaxID=3365777 RepID=UPI00380F525A
MRASGALLGAALLLAGCSSGDDGDRRDAGAPIGQQPKDTDPFRVDPDGNAARQVAAYAKAGKTTEAAQQADRTALLVLCNIPHRELPCLVFARCGPVA